jgi:hypothetical protein
MRRNGLFRIYPVMLLCAACGLLNLAAAGQEVTAALNGQVMDSSGAALPNAAITATDVNRGTKYSTKSDAAGEYYLPRLPVGTYKLQAQADGFATVEHSAFTLVLNQTARVDFNMTVGKVTQVSG